MQKALHLEQRVCSIVTFRTRIDTVAPYQCVKNTDRYRGALPVCYNGQMTFRNTEADCQWLLETHLRGRSFEFRSFTIIGNIDRPDELRIYAGTRPPSDAAPLALFVRGQFGLELRGTLKATPKIEIEVQKEEFHGPRKPTWLDFAKELKLL